MSTLADPLRRACSLLAFGLLVPLSASAQAFTDVIVFGDSLSDTGNGYLALAIAGYAPGRCSNGDVWSERFAEGIGLSADASSQGGTNFAFGGDETEDLELQIDIYSLTVGGVADPDALYVIWLGGNDILGIPSSPTATQDAVDNILDGVQDLQDLGARYFLIPNLPDIGRAYGDFSFPTGSGSVFSPAERDAVTALSLDFNTRLATDLANHSFVLLFELDIESLVEELFADPAGFGIVAAALDTSSDDTDFGIPCREDFFCLLDSQGSTPDGYFLYDAIHPTTSMHAVIADRAAELLPEPGAGWGLGSGWVLLATLRKRRASRASR